MEQQGRKAERMNTSVLNQKKIEGLSAEIGSENIPILLDIFIGEMGIYIDNLINIQGVEQQVYLKEISHALKSSAASFGAERLCELAISIDKKAKLNQCQDLENEVSAMLALLQITREVYSSWAN